MSSRAANEIEAERESYSSVALDRDELVRLLSEASVAGDFASLKARIVEVKALTSNSELKRQPADYGLNGNAIHLRRDVLASELDQILEAQTIERARYYVKRLERGVNKVKTSKLNDINLHRWKEYPDVITDSLWVLPKRDTAGAHLAWYWGNFIPQIPHQLMLRYTKKGDCVLDPFLGSGTTLIECRSLGRNGIGVELNPEVAREAGALIEKEPNRYSVETRVVTGNSRSLDLRPTLGELGVQQVQLLIMHPPYHDIIRFSEDHADLSSAETTEDFLKMFGAVVDNTTPLLEKGRYFALVIGDKYEKGEWVPLGFYCMNEVLKRDYSLKSIVVKNFDETRAKRDQKQLWRYRALVGGFYIFKHEYIFLFRKR
ncbi:MAG: DNA methyltransferase [Acidobacteriota bacterium]